MKEGERLGSSGWLWNVLERAPGELKGVKRENVGLDGRFSKPLAEL